LDDIDETSKSQERKNDSILPSNFQKKSNLEYKTIDNVTSSPMSSILKALPPKAQSYAQLARLDKPIGTMLLLWPCLWSTALASGSTIIHNTDPTALSPTLFVNVAGDPSLLGLFAAGSFLMRGAGCTINDMWDAKFDKQVSRTVTRPVASGAISYPQATAFLAIQLSGGLGILLSFPQEHLKYCFFLGAASLPLVGVYPLMKRFTNWPQLVLGMTFNWGALMGWAATHGSLDACNGLSVVLPLYAGGVAWTLVYDTLYAHQDKSDDAKLGLKSTALYFGEHTKPILLGFSSLATASWMLAGYNLGFDQPFYYIGCGGAGAHLFWQVLSADLDDPKNLAERFKSNSVTGAIIFGSCVAGNIGAMY
jgi:4-hydroxybenzoate polyprenyltransferase